MSLVVLFHSVYGLRPAVLEAADMLREAGHAVITPDLFNGRTTDDFDEARAFKDEIGLPILIERARTCAARAPKGAVFGGYSMGAYLASMMAGARSASGLILLHGVGEAHEGMQPAYPAQAHVAEGDEFATSEQVGEWVDAFREGGGEAEVFMYPSGGHIYTDPGLPSYDAESTQLTWDRVLSFLDKL